MKKIFKDALKNPVTHETYEERQLARVGNDGFEILTDGEWRSFEIKGFNINGEAPGNARYSYSGDYSYYASLLQSLGSMGGNCVRTYDLLPPEFYRALGEYNRSADSPIYLIQGIMTPPGIDPGAAPAMDEIRKISPLRFPPFTARALSPGTAPGKKPRMFNNVTPYLIGYIIDPRIDGGAADKLLAEESAGYEGRYISAASNAAEALAAELCDYTLSLLQDSYGCMQPGRRMRGDGEAGGRVLDRAGTADI